MIRTRAFEPKVIVEVRKLAGQRAAPLERKPMGRALTARPAYEAPGGNVQTAKAS